MLALRGIDKAYGRRRVLVGVSLDVAAGEVVLLVGRNGAGKTTLLRIATGFLDADAGTVAVAGIAMTDRARAQARFGYLPEHAPVPGDLIVEDHLRFRAQQKGCPSPREAVAAAVTATALAEVAHRRIGNLSKGYRQRVGLADALLGDPPVLILDEPTSGLDPLQVNELHTHLAGIAPDRAVLVSSHAVSDLRALASRIAVLRDGALVACDAPAALPDATILALLEGTT